MEQPKDESPFNFDLERMKKAVEAPFVILPTGLTSEQIEEFLMNVRTTKQFANGDKNDRT